MNCVGYSLILQDWNILKTFMLQPIIKRHKGVEAGLIFGLTFLIQAQVTEGEKESRVVRTLWTFKL